jgi:hypothetical protein
MYKIIILFPGVAILVAVMVSFSCSSSEEKIKQNDVMTDSLKYKMSIPPGMADVRAEILKCSEENEDFKCRILIKEILAYGSSTPMLSPGVEIESYVSKSLLEKESKKIKEGEIYLMRISQKRAPSDKEYWELIMFNNN